jgi:hypothetical protein
MISQEITDNKLKELLPHGAITRVAKKHKLSIQQVRNILIGKSKNHPVLQSLIEEAEPVKKIEDRMKALIVA